MRWSGKKDPHSARARDERGVSISAEIRMRSGEAEFVKSACKIVILTHAQ